VDIFFKTSNIFSNLIPGLALHKVLTRKIEEQELFYSSVKEIERVVGDLFLLR
jgi:hypothetical protein